ncbi:MAG: histidinol phosphate phosphatase domain-containing protein [Syntrophales bacterium]
MPPEYIYDLAVEARHTGAKIVVVHGETIAEPVAAGTNAAALRAPIDILAHPGLITKDEAMEAARNSICLEITARKGHSLTNGHVVKMARQAKAPLILNSDSHAPHDLVHKDMARKIALGAGLTEAETEVMFRNSQVLVKKTLKK